MTDEKGRVKAKLIIRGFECPPEEITSILGIAPQRVWLRAETVTAKAINRHESNGWLVESPLSPIDSYVEEQVDSLMTTLEPHINSFVNLPKNTNVEVYCTLSTSNYRSSVIQISQKAIQALEKIGASLSIDLM